MVLNPANAHVEEFVKDVSRARVIHVRTIMEKGSFSDAAATISENACCEDVLPLFAEHDWVGVTDAQNNIVGKVTAKQVLKALARHSGVT